MKKTLIAIIIGLRGVLGCIYGDSWIFATKEEAETAFPGESISYSVIADPSYDQTFKCIMSTDEKKVKYLMSFLNSIYFPGAKGNDVMIRSIEPLDKEKTELGKTNHSGITMCDVACKCVFYGYKGGKQYYDESVPMKRTLAESFDLEMQRSTQEYFTMRLIEYGQTLYNRYRSPVKALGLLNYSSKKEFEDESKCYAWCEIDPTTDEPTRLIGDKNILEMNTIDLRKLATTEDVRINGKELKIEGITWLKLFGVKQWCELTTLKGMQFGIYYPESISSEIKEVIEMLSKIDQASLDRMMRERANEEDVLNTAKKEGIQQGIQQTVKKMVDKGKSKEEIMDLLDLTQEQMSELIGCFK